MYTTTALNRAAISIYILLPAIDWGLLVTKSIFLFCQSVAHYLINNPKKFNVGIDDLGAKPCIPHKSLLQ